MKRNLFEELSEDFEALKNERRGKAPLKRHTAEKTTVPIITSCGLLTLPQNLNMSQAVFAQYLPTNKRTLDIWEQGRAKPNAQAAVLIKMVEKYPDTIERLGMI